jgi:hypothetical protein
MELEAVADSRQVSHAYKRKSPGARRQSKNNDTTMTAPNNTHFSR